MEATDWPTPEQCRSKLDELTEQYWNALELAEVLYLGRMALMNRLKELGIKEV